MAVTPGQTPKITVTTNDQWFEATLDIPAVMTVGTVYRLWRDYTDGRPAETVRVWAPANTSEIMTDYTPQVGVHQSYRLVVDGASTLVVASDKFVIRYDPALQADKPLWDTTHGSWPVLRTVSGGWLPPMRLPVSDYAADFGYRSTVMQVVGSEYPVVAADVAVMKSGELVFLTASNGERRRLIEYVRHNRTVHLASPCVDGLQHMFFRVLGVSESVPQKNRPLLRQWQVRFQQVPKPGWYGTGSWAGVRTWGHVKDNSASWADAASKFGATWGDWRGRPQSVPLGKRARMVEEGSW